MEAMPQSAAFRKENVMAGFDRRIDRLEQRFDALDDKMSRQCLWSVGIQITTLVAVVGAALSRA